MPKPLYLNFKNNVTKFNKPNQKKSIKIKIVWIKCYIILVKLNTIIIKDK